MSEDWLLCENTAILLTESQEALFSINYLNGLMNETRECAGLFYLLDDCIYQYLSDILGDTAEIRVTTYRDYTRILVQCASLSVVSVLRSTLKALSGFSAKKADFEDCRENAMDRSLRSLPDSHDFCRAVCFDAERYRIGICGTEESLSKITVESLDEAYCRHYTPKNRFFCFTGIRKEDIREIKSLCRERTIALLPKDKPPVLTYHPGRFRYAMTDWDDTECALALPLPQTEYNHFAVEMLCKIFETRLRRKKNLCMEVDKVLYYLNYGAKLIIFGFSFANDTEVDVFQPIESVTGKPVSEAELTAAKEKMIRSYESILKDPLDFMTFVTEDFVNNTMYDLSVFDVFHSYIASMEVKELERVRKELCVSDLSGVTIGGHRPLSGFLP